MRDHSIPLPRLCARPECGFPFQRRTGSYCSPPCAYLHRTKTVADRFWAKVDRNGPVPAHRPELGQCWIWKGGLDGGGYGCLGAEPVASGERPAAPLKAHRVAYELQHGRIPAGHDVCHHCDNPPCVRGDHLFTGTRGDNMRDCVLKGRESHGSAKHRENVQKGEGRYNARLTPADVRAIRRRYAAGGVTYPELAREYPVTAHVIGQIVRRTRWKHVE